MITNSLSSMQQRAPTKKTTKPKKNKNKAIKVVYISNPMKVKTSASEFRALVQELTGQNAELPSDPSRYDGGLHNNIIVNSDEDCVKKIDHTLVNMPSKVDPNNVCGENLDGVSLMENFEPFDDVFTPQMIESISAFLPDSVFCEC